MTFQIIQSIPLNTDAKAAWRRHGGIFMRRDRNERSLREFAMGMERDYTSSFTLNLGNSSVDGDAWPVPFFNTAGDIAKIITPGATRRFIPDLLPPAPFVYPGDGWIKRPGRGGRGKTRTELRASDLVGLPREWDIQKHIVGREFRVNTVGRRIVQAHARTDSLDDPTHRNYEWVGLGGLPADLASHVRDACSRFESDTVLGWDVIYEDETSMTYILEGNSCPGVNEPTVERIVREIRRQIGER